VFLTFVVCVLLFFVIILTVQVSGIRNELNELRKALTRAPHPVVPHPVVPQPVVAQAPLMMPPPGVAQPQPAMPQPAVPQPVVPQPAMPQPVAAQPVVAQAAAQPAVAQAPLMPVMAPQPWPVGQPNIVPPVRIPASPPRKWNLNEGFLGRNILPLIAAVLGLIGLIFLGILVVPHLGDAVKIGLMFVISLAIGGVGYALNRRRSTVLSQALIGTGLGGLFIAILVTQLFFHAINDLVALILLAVWIVVGQWLSEQTKSLLVAILAHAGMVISITYSYFARLEDDRLAMLVVFQMVATIAIVLGNYLWVKAMYRWGLYASQIMVIVSVAAMWHRFWQSGTGFNSGLSTGLIAAGFVVQFIAACVIACLLFVSGATVKSETADEMADGLAVANVALWVAALVMAITVLTVKLLGGHFNVTANLFIDYRTVPLAFMGSAGLAILPALALALLHRVKGQLAEENVTAVALAVASAGLLLFNLAASHQHYYPAVGWLVGLGAAYLAFGWIARSRVYTMIAGPILVVDGAMMLLPGLGYASLTASWTVWASLGYLAVLVGLAHLVWRQLRPMIAPSLVGFLLAVRFLAVEASLARLLLSSGLSIGVDLLVLMTACILITMRVTKSGADAFFRVMELVVLAVAVGRLWWLGAFRYGQPQGTSDFTGTALTAALVISTVAVVALSGLLIHRVILAGRVSSAAWRNGAPVPAATIEVWSGVGLSLAAWGVFTPYQWFINHSGFDFVGGYPASLVLMVAALVIVGLGMWSRIKPLRIFGLIVVMACVLKLVTLDIGSVTSITRVVAFLGGAVVCFGISALYNYAARHFDKELAGVPTTPGSGTGYSPGQPPRP